MTEPVLKEISMADEEQENEKPVRVQFPKDATAGSIADAIRNAQNEWARKHPERAHQLYPDVYSETGERN
jgi:hypothetical protein